MNFLMSSSKPLGVPKKELMEIKRRTSRQEKEDVVNNKQENAVMVDKEVSPPSTSPIMNM